MLASQSWVFQATPSTSDLVVELRSKDELAWTISRHGKDVQAGDRVFYWQAGRDAGIYGVGRVEGVSARTPAGRYTVRTIHDYALFAPILRDELRADKVLHDMAVLRHPRGTVFPLSGPECEELERRMDGRRPAQASSATRPATVRRQRPTRPRANRTTSAASGRRVAEMPAVYGASRTFAPDPAEVMGELELPRSLLGQVVAAVNAGQHIILMGLPGTGKTTLALNLARAAARAGWCAGPLTTTATADWTTFETIGGLVPDQDGTLRFAEGVVLRALREERWLVLDELNRADIDKAFGPLLTVLSGGSVDLPTITVDRRPVRVVPSSGDSGVMDDGSTYRLGRRWRIIATMNTVDRAALFSFSLAFARRFAFVLVPPPQPAAVIELVKRKIDIDDRLLAAVDYVVRKAPRPLGPAVVLDAARYAAARASSNALAEAVGAFVLPQLDGIEGSRLLAYVRDLRSILDPEGEAVLLDYAKALTSSDI